MALRRNGMEDSDDLMDDGEYQRAMEMCNELRMNKVEILLEDDRYWNLLGKMET
jgi:hypothetical protein